MRAAAACGALLALLAHAAGAQPFARTEERAACAHFDPLRRPFFGDLHVHTAYSFDGWGQGTRNLPRDAYRFARGEELGIQPYDAGGAPRRTVRLRRPLDFAMVSDHAELLGETALCQTPGAPGYDSFLCVVNRRWPKLGYALSNAATYANATPRRFAMCGADGEGCRAAASAAWREIQRAAEEAYDRSPACRFTSFVGSEWTGMPGGNNVHRNVVYRNATVPARPPNYIDDPDEEALWSRLEEDCIRARGGCDALAIPHNSNVSGGLLFQTVRKDGAAIGRADAERRAALERLVEVTQHKGDSECRGGNAADELCGFEKLAYARLDEMASPRMYTSPPARSFWREALGEGLVQRARLGSNPFAFGAIGSTDTHLATPGLVDEDRFVGHAAGTVSARLEIPPLPDRLDFNPGGLAVLWAEESSRDALFEAMRRREAYGTSGPRMVVRFFGGFELPEDACARDDFVAQGYAGGVPMGGELAAMPGGGAPRFQVSALRDPGTPDRPGTRLQRVQIVKGWVEGGTAKERVFEVAGDARNGAGVDLATCQPRGPGADALCAVWRDPAFDARAHAFYYARVVENPSCRWSQWACNARGVDCADPSRVPRELAGCCDPAVPKTIQERAWTSPIFVSPVEEPR